MSKLKTNHQPKFLARHTSQLNADERKEKGRKYSTTPGARRGKVAAEEAPKEKGP